MKHRIARTMTVALLGVGCVGAPASWAQEAQTGTGPGLGATTTTNEAVVEYPHTNLTMSTRGRVINPGRSPVVSEVLNMLASGVSKEVVKTYIEESSMPHHLTAADLITLKKESVPDEITTAILKRSGELRAANRPPAPQPMAPAVQRGPGPNPTIGGMDPEGYDFWWYHYAYPRALASANERLLSSYWPYYEGYQYPYGHNGRFGPRPFGPYPRGW